MCDGLVRLRADPKGRLRLLVEIFDCRATWRHGPVRQDGFLSQGRYMTRADRINAWLGVDLYEGTTVRKEFDLGSPPFFSARLPEVHVRAKPEVFRNGRRLKSSTARVVVECPCCRKDIPAGRLAQHAVVHFRKGQGS